MEDVAELSLTAGQGGPEKGRRRGVGVAQLVLQRGQHRIHLHHPRQSSLFFSLAHLLEAVLVLGIGCELCQEVDVGEIVEAVEHGAQHQLKIGERFNSIFLVRTHLGKVELDCLSEPLSQGLQLVTDLDRQSWSKKIYSTTRLKISFLN